MADKVQASPSRDLEKVASLKRTLGDLSKIYEKCKVELLQLKIQTAYNENAVKDAEAKSMVMRKRLREVEEDSRRFEKLLRESLAVRQKLEEKVNDLKLSIVMAGIDSPKFDSR